jgi:hypothetical protein
MTAHCPLSIDDDPIELLRALKGAALHCLYALTLAGRPLNAGAVARLTCYSYNTVTAALARLGALGLASYDPRASTWRPGASAAQSQVPQLPQGPVDPALLARYVRRRSRPALPAAGPVAPSGGDPGLPADFHLRPDPLVGEADRLNIREGLPASETDRLSFRDKSAEMAVDQLNFRGEPVVEGLDQLNFRDESTGEGLDQLNYRVESAESQPDRFNFRDDRQLNTTAADPLFINYPEEAAGRVTAERTTSAGRTASAKARRNRQQVADEARPSDLRLALRNAGIGQPKAGQLARLPHVSARYVCAHLARARREGTATGLLIFRIQQADPKPPPCPGGLCPVCILPERDEVAPGPPETEADPGETVSAFTPPQPARRPTGDPSLDLSVAGAGRSANQCWETARALLKAGLARSAYTHYLAPARLARYEPADRTFVIAASTPEACAWLEDRLARRLQQALQGLLDAPVRLCFIALSESPLPQH